MTVHRISRTYCLSYRSFQIMTNAFKLALGVSLTAIFFAAAPVFSQDVKDKEEDAKWDVSNPPG